MVTTILWLPRSASYEKIDEKNVETSIAQGEVFSEVNEKLVVKYIGIAVSLVNDRLVDLGQQSKSGKEGERVGAQIMGRRRMVT